MIPGDKICPLCRTSKSKTIFKRGDYSVTECANCSLGRLNKIPTPKEVRKLYSKNYFNDKRSKAFFAGAKRNVQLVRRFIQPPASLLDFGCGLGHFPKILKEAGFEVAGYDLSNYAASFVKKTYNIETYTGSLEKISSLKEAFDGVTIWDVIEHVPNFMKTLKTIRHVLKKDGLLFLTTPNSKSLEARLSGRYWYGYTKIPEHINFFSPKSIRVALREAGFKPIEIRRWGFARDLNYILGKTIPSLRLIFGESALRDKILYLPLIDMLIVAQKKSQDS
jgi:2-polyprenyl-3-methyl-5-hydroxy-6-metoxy-1,4-benzoquinol methylase